MSNERHSTTSEDFEAQLEKLRTALADSLVLFNSTPEGRVGALTALNAVHDFIESVPELRGRQLSTPLVVFACALADLERGMTPRMLMKAVREGGRPPTATGRGAIKGGAAAVMTRLMRAGFDKKAAAEAVAQKLRELGVSNDGRRDLTAQTVASWRNSMSTGNDDDPSVATYRAIMSMDSADLTPSGHYPPMASPERALFLEYCLASLELTIRHAKT